MGETEAYRVNFGSSLIDFLPFLLWSICPPSPISSIDCAGILKLRNSDIELRKGETDIGRKNTRVRLVFRVHIPQPSGKVLSLQTASIPVECCKISLSFFFLLLLYSCFLHVSTVASFWQYLLAELYVKIVCEELNYQKLMVLAKWKLGGLEENQEFGL